MANVLDSSAVLALLNREPGAERVASVLGEGIISSVNAAEVYRVLMRAGAPRSAATAMMARLNLQLIPFESGDALEAAQLGARHTRLSLGDCACIALAGRVSAEALVTADRAWATLDLGVRLTVIR
jgi:PIN domain nuclease of toxin-antitoxin system